MKITLTIDSKNISNLTGLQIPKIFPNPINQSKFKKFFVS